MRRILFFQPIVQGHYLEYLHHEYIEASRNVDCEYYFVVPLEFLERKKMLVWQEATNIKILYLQNKEYKKCSNGSSILNGFWTAIIVRKYVNKTSASFVFLNSLINSMPFLPFFIPSNCQVLGIVYGIFLWNRKKMGFSKRWINRVIYWLFAHHKSFHAIYLLNDKDSVIKLNKFYSVDRFKYLPDPIPTVNLDNLEDIRSKLNVAPTDKVYLQLGIQPRKHITEIFKAIDLAELEDLNDKVFIFTGVFSENYEIEYRKWLDKLSVKARIIDLSGRIPFSELFNLFYISDYSFALYDNTNMSSGVLGYCAFFDTIIIGPNNGLLGHLIKDNNLGICIDSINPSSILSAIKQDAKITTKDYCIKHTISEFNNYIFKEMQMCIDKNKIYNYNTDEENSI